mmetsp:Transcript_17044/g.25804  ORF Transcript_17044/g.25804 Transcript_17044/m.25804 type:complete len:118 (-) Transcript_17044:25-378(-)
MLKPCNIFFTLLTDLTNLLRKSLDLLIQNAVNSSIAAVIFMTTAIAMFSIRHDLYGNDAVSVSAFLFLLYCGLPQKHERKHRPERLTQLLSRTSHSTPFQDWSMDAYRLFIKSAPSL